MLEEKGQERKEEFDLDYHVTSLNKSHALSMYCGQPKGQRKDQKRLSLYALIGLGLEVWQSLTKVHD